jgi:putative transposase
VWVVCSLRTGAFGVRVFGASIPSAAREEPMKASQFTDAQNGFILKQDEEGVPVAEICRKAEISHASQVHRKRHHHS